MATDSQLHWDPFDYGLHEDPHPMWRRMMDEMPLYRNEEWDFWALTRFDDVVNGFVDWKTFSSARGDQLEIIQGDPPDWLGLQLLSLDPPKHTVMRRLLSRAFTPRRISELEPVTRHYTRELLDQFVGSSQFDFVEDFGGKLPGMVIASMLGIPDADRERIRQLSDELIHRDPAETDTERLSRVGTELGEYFYAQLMERRKRPTDDMMSALLSVEVTDDDGTVRRLNDEEAVAYTHLLAVAGNETTAKLIGWIGSSLALFPAERAKLVERSDLIPNAVEEVLRYEPPALCLARVVQRDFEIHGQVVPEGAVMVFIQAATGRDPRVFKDPEVFDVERKIERHLSFAFGPHVCLGAALARLEARIAIEEVLARFPEWDVDWTNCEIVHTGSAVRGYARLPVRVS